MKSSRTIPVMMFVLAVAAVLGVAFWFYHSARQNAWHDAEGELRTIAQFKAEQLVQWRSERLADASVIMDSKYLSEGVEAWLETKSPAEMEKLIHRLRSTAQHYQYRDVLLADVNGQVLLSVSGHGGRLHEEMERTLDAAVRERRAVLSDLHPGDGGLTVHLGVIAPLFAGGAGTGEPIGAIILQCNAEQYLYPLIESWPVPSDSGETVFFRREGDEVLFLSPLRFQKDAALNLRVPLTRREVPAVMAVRGKTGVMEGTDYRGVEVLSYLLAVPDSPWFLVVKQDTGEVFAPLRQKALTTAVFVALLILILALAFGFVWQQRAAAQEVHLLNVGLEERVRERTAELRQSEEKLSATFDQAAVGIAHVGLDGRWLHVNQRLCDIVGYSRQELLSLTFQDITHPDDLDLDLRFIQEILEGKRTTYTMEKRYIRKDHSTVWIELTVSVIRHADGTPEHFISIIANIDDRKQAEEKAEQEHLFSDSVISSLPGVFYVIGTEGRFRRWNTNFEIVNGYSHSEMLTLSPLDLFTGDDKQLIADSIRQTFESGEVLVEAELVSKSGTRQPYLFTGVRVDLGGESLLVGMGLNISDRKQAQEALREGEARYRSIFEDVPVSIWEEDWSGLIRRIDDLRSSGVVDFQRHFNQHPEEVAQALSAVRILDVNPETVRMFQGENKKDFLASLETVFATPDTLPGFIGELLALAEGKRVYETEMRLCTVHKEIVHVLLKMIFPPPGDPSTNVFVCLMDITGRKRIEEELRLHRDNLEQLVAARTVELEAVNHELEAFSYSVSHDLKAPLRSVDGFARMLEEDYAERLDDEGRRLLKVVRDSARDMGQLVNDLLAFSRLSRKELAVARLDLRRLAEDACREVERDAAGRTLRWEIGELPSAFGDEATIREVLLNLFANAVKFTRPRKEAVIGFSGHAEAGEVVYSVTDNGVGFDMTYEDKLFSVFQRLHTSDEFEGTGIGLALVQRIIQRHGGRVWAEGEQDKGASISFTLPRDGGGNNEQS